MYVHDKVKVHVHVHVSVLTYVVCNMLCRWQKLTLNSPNTNRNTSELIVDPVYLYIHVYMCHVFHDVMHWWCMLCVCVRACVHACVCLSWCINCVYMLCVLWCRSRLKAKNLMYVNHILDILNCLVKAVTGTHVMLLVSICTWWSGWTASFRPVRMLLSMYICIYMLQCVCHYSVLCSCSIYSG